MDGPGPLFGGLEDEIGLRGLNLGQVVSLDLIFLLKMELVVFYRFIPRTE